MFLCVKLIIIKLERELKNEKKLVESLSFEKKYYFINNNK